MVTAPIIRWMRAVLPDQLVGHGFHMDNVYMGRGRHGPVAASRHLWCLLCLVCLVSRVSRVSCVLVCLVCLVSLVSWLSSLGS